jgi:hypothetical protein
LKKLLDPRNTEVHFRLSYNFIIGTHHYQANA